MMLGGERPAVSAGEVTAFADGTLPPARHQPVGRTVMRSPDLRAAVAAQRRVLHAIGGAATHAAPSGLRARVTLMRRPARSRSARPVRLDMVGVVAVAAGAVTMTVVIVVLAGLRRDRLSKRVATTVFYSHGLRVVAYEIVTGPPLLLGAAAQTTSRHGVLFRTIATGRGPIITWVRRGHTCLLTGTGTSAGMLLRLASWREGGRLSY